jgi:hypothetical protein
MPSITDRAVTAATAQADRPAVVCFRGALIEHVFMTRGSKNPDGSYTKREPTGEVAYVYRISPIMADRTVSTSGAIWLWLEPARKAGTATKFDPALLRAYRSSFPKLAEDIDALEAEAVENGDWKALATKAVAPAPVAPPKKGLAARAAREAAESDGAKSVDLDAAVSDLPF